MTHFALKASVFTALVALAVAPALAADSPKSIEGMHVFGKCLALNSPKDGAALVGFAHGSKPYQAALKTTTAKHAKCAKAGTTGFGGTVFPGAVAEELLEFGRSKADVAALLRRKAKVAVKPLNPTDGIALCAVRANPAGIANLLATPPAGKEEQAALKALGKAIDGCAKGKKLGASGPAARSALALAAFRISRGA